MLPSTVEARMLWAACCLGYFGFMRAGEFTLDTRSAQPSIYREDVAVDSHHDPTLVRIRLHRAKTDPFGRGVDIFISRTNSNLCPVAAVLGYMAVRPQVEGPLLVHEDGSPLTRDQFVKLVRGALRVAGIDNSAYAGHSFRIRAATAAAAAGVPAHFIKMLGRWESNAYQVYLRTPRESLASVSQLIAE